MARLTSEVILGLGGYIEFNLADARLYRLSGHNAPAYPAAGGDVDGVTVVIDDPAGNLKGNGVPITTPKQLLPALPGREVQVEAAASITVGQSLETTADGRVQPRTSGTIVMRALESASTGALLWAVFTSGR